MLGCISTFAFPESCPSAWIARPHRRAEPDVVSETGAQVLAEAATRVLALQGAEPVRRRRALLGIGCRRHGAQVVVGTRLGGYVNISPPVEHEGESWFSVDLTLTRSSGPTAVSRMWIARVRGRRVRRQGSSPSAWAVPAARPIGPSERLRLAGLPSPTLRSRWRREDQVSATGTAIGDNLSGTTGQKGKARRGGEQPHQRDAHSGHPIPRATRRNAYQPPHGRGTG